jgi:lysophospholipase L1-like esterase
MKDLFKNIAFSLFSMLLFLLLAEGSLRLIDFVKGFYYPKRVIGLAQEYYRFSDNPQLAFEPMPGSYKDGVFINSRGYRGPEFTEKKEEGVFRILSIGDSCTFGGYPNYWGKDQRFTINGHRYEVINGGVEGYRSWQVLEKLRLSIKYEPDLVIIFVGNNDIFNNPPSFKRFTEKSFLVKQLVYFRYLRRNVLDKSLLVYNLRTFLLRKVKPRLFKRVLRAEDFDKTKIYADYYPDFYEKNLLKMIKICRDNKIQVALVTLPCIISPNMSEAAVRRTHAPFYANNLGYVKIIYDRYNEAIKKVSQQENLPLADLAELFDQMTDKEKYFTDLIHMSPQGYKMCKDTIEQVLRDAQIIY